ncbi:MAG: response regulator [Proteobacteria bacterium]|nr:response regulator [Pseudomonadota bacterium]
MKILIVDDDLANRQLLQYMLKPFGEIASAEDGEEAYRAFESAHEKKEPFEIIFLDIMMPIMDGHEVLKKIREWEEKSLQYGFGEVKIVMVSALGSKEHVLASFKEGCEYYLVKPVTTTKLNEVMVEMGYEV